MDRKTLNLIHAATQRFVLTPEGAEVVEWDRTTPVNDVAPKLVIESLSSPDTGRCPEARVVIMRVLALDVVLYVQATHPVTNAPLHSDADVAWTIDYLRTVRLPALIANPAELQRGLAGALTKRIMEGVEQERRLGVL